jgi:hypothetical protein
VAVTPNFVAEHKLRTHGEPGSFAAAAAPDVPGLPEAAQGKVPDHAAAWNTAHAPDPAGRHDVQNLAPVPEPDTYALVLAGLGIVGLRCMSMRKKDIRHLGVSRVGWRDEV